MQPLCDQKLHFSVADQSASGRRQISLKIGDQSATGGRFGLPTDWKWVATGRQLVGDWSAMSWRLTFEQTICCVGVIMNKALIKCYHGIIVYFWVIYCLGYA